MKQGGGAARCGALSGPTTDGMRSDGGQANAACDGAGALTLAYVA